MLILIFLISQINSQLFNTVSIIKSRAVDIKLPRQLNHSVLHLIHPNYVFFLSNSVEAQTTHIHQPHRQTLPNINPHTFNLTNLTINTRLRAKIYYSLTSHRQHLAHRFQTIYIYMRAIFLWWGRKKFLPPRRFWAVRL